MKPEQTTAATPSIKPTPEQLALLVRLSTAYRALGNQMDNMVRELHQQGVPDHTGILACLRIADKVGFELSLLIDSYKLHP